MPHRQRTIFVLDIRNEAAFAFEAETLVQAEGLTHAPWFARAVGEFYASKHGRCDDGVARRIRSATKREASTYRDYADEFADLSDHFLIAHLSEADRACR
jgi:hypothetical protein